jgi:hypothetical protein
MPMPRPPCGSSRSTNARQEAANRCRSGWPVPATAEVQRRAAQRSPDQAGVSWGWQDVGLEGIEPSTSPLSVPASIALWTLVSGTRRHWPQASSHTGPERRSDGHDSPGRQHPALSSTGLSRPHVNAGPQTGHTLGPAQVDQGRTVNLESHSSAACTVPKLIGRVRFPSPALVIAHLPPSGRAASG